MKTIKLFIISLLALSLFGCTSNKVAVKPSDEELTEKYEEKLFGDWVCHDIRSDTNEFVDYRDITFSFKENDMWNLYEYSNRYTTESGSFTCNRNQVIFSDQEDIETTCGYFFWNDYLILDCEGYEITLEKGTLEN